MERAAKRVKVAQPRWFRFRSKMNGEAGYLSNFTPLPDRPLFFTVGEEKFTAPTIEHAFQALKFDTLVGPARPDLARQVVQLTEAKDARRAGNKKAFKKHGVQLDVPRWMSRRDDLMKELLQQRVALDRPFRRILERLVADGYKLLHIPQRVTGELYWEGHVPKNDDTQPMKGRNRLGELMMELMND